MYKKEVLKQTINLRKEYRIGMDIICDLVLKNKGIVYGGYVRDKILQEYYTELFFNSSKNKKILKNNYWEPNFHKDTKQRVIVPKDIDVHFKELHDYEYFYEDLCKKFDIVTTTIDNFVIYKKNRKILVKKINVMYEIGKKLSEDGDCLFFQIDVRIIDKLEPPFDCLDFYTNSIIIDGKNNYRLSKNTGILMNHNNHFNYIKLYEIIKMIHENKTILTKKINNDSEVKIIILKIIDMINNYWIIENFDQIVKCKNKNENNCIICLENNPHLQIKNCSYVHEYCFRKYLEVTGVHKENGSYFIMGPQREKIIFNVP